MKLKFKTKQKAGLSLVELVIVLAISGLMIIVALTTFGQRKTVATKDAVNQLVADLQRVRNEAQKGLGPTTTTGNDAIGPGETLYGEAVMFSNGCSGSNAKGCLVVYKLKLSANKTQISDYESYNMPLNESLSFVWSGVDCQTSYMGCYSLKESYLPVSGSFPMVVYLNGSGDAYSTPAKVNLKTIPSHKTLAITTLTIRVT
jgi:type II secretory pathway pseudopilin PulG